MDQKLNQGMIQSPLQTLISLSGFERTRIQEPQSDPRRIEAFTEIDSLVTQSLNPPVPTSSAAPSVLSPKLSPPAPRKMLASTLPDQALLKRLLAHRPHYQSGRILRGKPQ
jgi:hypothetical protein